MSKKDGIEESDELQLSKPRQPKLGRYSLHYLLGRGGMASVYLSRLVGRSGFERWVAIKQMHEHLLDSPEIRNMFLDEARTAARLQHPNLVQVTDFGEDDELPFIVMEYVNGETMSSLLRRLKTTSKTLPIPIATRMMAWACDGLHHAHELKTDAGEPLNLVHRDISPQNILVTYEGSIKVTDFGIAKAANHLVQTRTGQLKGKTAYMSPEQVFGQPLDRRSDIFALGICLYEATLGTRLFRTENEFETLQRITSGDIPRPKSVDPKYPAKLEEIVLKALNPLPVERFQTARDMQRSLEKFLAGLGEPVGTADVAELMESLFKDRMELRRNKLSLVVENDLERPMFVTGEHSPASSISIPGNLMTPPDLKIPKRKRSYLIPLIIVSILAGLGTGVLVLSYSELSGVPAPANDASTTVVLNQRETSAKTIDAGPSIVEITDSGSKTGDVNQESSPASDGSVGQDALKTVEQDAQLSKNQKKTGTQKVRPQYIARPPGRISIITTPWAEVYLGAKHLGRTPIIRRTVPSGRHTLRLMPQGKQPAKRRTVVVRPNEETPVNVNLN